jgi:hypothetical protein
MEKEGILDDYTWQNLVWKDTAENQQLPMDRLGSLKVGK